MITLSTEDVERLLETGEIKVTSPNLGRAGYNGSMRIRIDDDVSIADVDAR